MRHLLLLLIPLSASAQVAHHWHLDESTGSTAMDIAGGATGVLQNNVTWAPLGGHFGGAARGNGNDARILLGPCDLTTGPGDEITLSAWFKPDIVSQSERMLICKTTGPSTNDMVWSLSLVNATAARFRVRSGGVVTELSTSPSSIFSGTWYHLAGVYDGNEMRIYLNGALMAFAPKSGLIGFHPQAPASMFNPPSSSIPFFGWLDDVRIYDRALTDQEVLQLVIGSVPTSIQALERPHLLNDRVLALPGHDFHELLLSDLSGRTLLHRSATPGEVLTLPADLPTGPYLVCLLGKEGRTGTRLFVP